MLKHLVIIYFILLTLEFRFLLCFVEQRIVYSFLNDIKQDDENATEIVQPPKVKSLEGILDNLKK